MKTFNPCIIFVSLLTLSLAAACSNDDDSSSPSSRITIDGVDYELISGLITSTAGDEPGTFETTVVLTGEGISISASGDLNGRGTVVVAQFVTNAANELPNGTYTVAAGTFEGAGAIVDLEIDNSSFITITTADQLIGTTVTVDGLTGAKTIVQNFTRQNGSSGSLNFVGELQQVF